MARIGRCEVTEEGCDDPRCKIGACVLAAEERRATEAATVIRRAKVREAAIEIVDEVFKSRRRQASPAELAEWLAMPAVQEEAERRVLAAEELAKSTVIDWASMFKPKRPT